MSNDNKIHVYVRDEDQAEGLFLCACRHDEVEDIIPMLESWGLYLNDRNYSDLHGSLSGQFAAVGGRIVFEVIADPEGDE